MAGEGEEAPAKEEEEQEEMCGDAIKYNLAMQAKDKGAELYKVQQFAAAREKWQEALEMVMEIAAGKDSELWRFKLSLHLNLSQAALQMKEWEEVVEQASKVLKLDAENSKGFYRRGLGQDALGRAQAAASDMQRAARLEPKSAEIRRKYEELKKKALESGKEEDDVPPVHNLMQLPRVFIDVAIGDKPAKRLVFALYTDVVPKTAENFKQLCTGEHAGVTARGKRFHYKGSVLHRMLPGLMVQGGDFENTNGTGGESIYDRRFPDEGFRDKFTRRGLLAMANDGPNTNGSGFFVTFAEAEHLDRRHTIFGEVTNGMELLDELEKLETDDECRPLVDCVITDCGECGPGGATTGGSAPA
mmetsp:Transcript_149174/g.479114  ORF Transcript_149174/g.479114 Transcript_149174/m.479114 type:complete len:359 (-) Transcript_149174:46-1122(-)